MRASAPQDVLRLRGGSGRSLTNAATGVLVVCSAHWLALVLACAPAAASDSEIQAVVEPVRLYGYVIGDIIELHARVPVPSGYAPDAGRLPKAGRVNAFLELRSVEPEDGRLQRYRGGESDARLSLRYLVVNSSAQVRSVQTPALVLAYHREGAPDVAVHIPQVELTVSPLTPEYVAGTAGLGEMQADAPPPRLSAGGPKRRLLLYALVAAALAGYVAWRQGWVPRRLLARRPFARAVRDIRRMRRDTTAQSQTAGAQRLHRAFDEAAGFAVASHSLEQFLVAQPWSATREAEIRDFFARSARFFYAGDGAAMLPPSDLARLARGLAASEPRRGGA